MKFITTYILFTLSFICSLMSAQYKSVEQFNLSNGLPNNGVTSLLQDSKGYLWIGTYDGLARYNGHSLTTYTNSIESKIFQSNRIRSLFESPNTDIWIGTDFGVTIFDRSMGQFVNLESMPNTLRDKECIIREIMLSEDKSQVYCLTERNGVLIYSIDGQLLKHLTIDREAIFQDALYLADEKYILVSNKGVVLYDFLTAEMQPIYQTNGESNLVGTLTRLDNSTILYGSTFGVRKISYSANESAYNFIIQEEANYLQRGYKTLQVDSNGGLWAGSISQGLFYLPDAKNNWGEPFERVSESMRHSALLDSYSESMWAATFDNGLFKYQREQQYFKSLDLNGVKVKPIRTVRVVPYDNNTILYQNSYQNLSFYDLESGKERTLPFALSAQEMKNLRYIAKLKNGEVWMFMSDGTRSWRLINSNNSNKLYRIDDELMADFRYDFPYTITEDYLGYLWIGSSSSLHRIAIGDDNKIESVNSISEHSIVQDVRVEKINTIFSDPQSESIWFGSSSQGLFNLKYDKTESLASATIENYRADESASDAISSNFVSSVNRLNGTLWVATEQGGLCRVDESESTPKFIPYSTNDGLPSNSVKSILSDGDGNIWISTNFGLGRYDQLNDKFMIYRAEQGVPCDEFICVSALMDDTLIFGSPYNVCYFKPSALPQSSPAPKIEFNTLKIFNDIVAPTQEFNGRVILSQALSHGDKVRLKHNENMISIGVDALYRDNSHDDDIRYRVLPLSDRWISIPYNTYEITLSGLKHGDYTLEVATSDFFGEKSDTNTLQIVIAPPFWLSVWAYILYTLLIISIATIAIYFISNLQRLRYRLHIEQINKHNAEVMNAEKLRYFSNISHELKTPLTLIVAPLSMLLDRFVVDVDVRSKLDIIKRQSDKIIRLIDLAQGIQLSDSNLLKRNDSRFSFNDFIANTVDDFKLMASYDDKSFVVDSPDVDIIVEADNEMLEKIINNLLSNAFKYTRSGQSIKLNYTIEEQNLIIKVEDSGYGISKADIDRVFERFFRARQRGSANVGGTGIGLYFTKTLIELHGGVIDVESELNQGSTFTVSLPIVREQHYLEPKESTSAENFKEQILGELTIERISSESEFKDSMVYIVEDNSEMRQFVSSVISKFFCVKTFANGAECYEAMKEQWPDIVVSDVMMPVMDGYELCEALKSDIKTSHIPIILLTACSTVDDKIKGLKYGADAYIPKPFYPNHMITRIETLLTNRKQLRERFQINMPIVYGETSSMRAKDNDFLEQLYQIFADNLDNEELDVELIVGEFGINRNLFFQKVKAITNASPRELLLTYRLKRAAEYLQSGEHNVNEVCDLTGFKSRSHFSRLFKEKYEVSPSQYSKKI